MASLRYAARALLATPGFTVVAIATLALGIAVNTAIFSVVNAVLLRPLPFRDEARVVRVWTTNTRGERSNHSAGDFLDLKRENRSLAAIAGYRGELAAASAKPGETVQLGLEHVTADFFDVLGTPPALGRTFTGAADLRGERQVVIGDEAWQKLFDRDASAVGRRVRINGEPCTVVAVMPKRFEWIDGSSLWLLAQQPVPPSPLDVKEADPLTNRDSHYFEAVAHLAPDVTIAQAQQDLHAIAATIQRDHPDNGGRDVRLVPVREDLVGDVRDALLVIQGAVGLVLLVACANVSSLLIARGAGRRRELTIRAALGASRARLVSQLLAETALLGLGGGLLGLLASLWLVQALVRLMPDGVPRAASVSVDVPVMLVTLAAALTTSVLFGVVPALQASRVDSAQALKQSGDRGSSRTRGRAALVIGEIALTLVLLAGAGVLGRSFVRLQQVDPGFAVEHATVADLMLPQTRYPKGTDQARLYHRLIDGLAARGGLQAVAVGFPGPFHGANASGSFVREGDDMHAKGERPRANIAAVSGGYFAAMGIPRIAGRAFDDRDRAEGPDVAIVNTTLAGRYWPGQDPIGKRIRTDDDPKTPWTTVVGLVVDTRQLGLKEAPPPLLYVPYEQFSLPFTTVAVRSGLPQASVVALLKAELAAVDPDLAFGDINPLETEVRGSLAEARFRTLLIGLFAALAVALAAIGLYGLISYTVAQRTREIGIRVALGAAPRQVLLPSVTDGVVLALAGIACGVVAAVAAGRALSAFVFGVGTSDPLTLAGVSALLLLVAAAASYLPSRRALKVDPIVALRAE
ncbi:MAG TPA: ABC transporter permease [Vicinamibacterales bacterium]|jgi:putative ABC transport system permease protein